jgi:hypothetical protein
MYTAMHKAKHLALPTSSHATEEEFVSLRHGSAFDFIVSQINPHSRHLRVNVFEELRQAALFQGLLLTYSNV